MATSFPSLNSYDTLAQYCLQQLGSPVIDIHVADEQVQNRIYDAIQFFREFHGDANERTFLKHQVRDNQIGCVDATSFQFGEIVTGQTSGTTATVSAIFPGELQVGTPTGSGFVVGENIKGAFTQAVAPITSYVTGDIDNGWLPVDPSVVAIQRVYPIAGGANSNSQFSAAYQVKVNDIYNLASSTGMLATGGLSYYEETKQYLNMMDGILLGEQMFRYNKNTGKLFIDFSWRDNVYPGQFILVECFQIVDQDAYQAVWDDRMLKKLAVAYVKKQWGNNLKLHSGIVLPGGIQINGQQIYDEAIDEIEKIEEQIIDMYQEPPMMLVG